MAKALNIWIEATLTSLKSADNHCTISEIYSDTTERSCGDHSPYKNSSALNSLMVDIAQHTLRFLDIEQSVRQHYVTEQQKKISSHVMNYLSHKEIAGYPQHFLAAMFNADLSTPFLASMLHVIEDQSKMDEGELRHPFTKFLSPKAAARFVEVCFEAGRMDLAVRCVQTYDFLFGLLDCVAEDETHQSKRLHAAAQCITRLGEATRAEELPAFSTWVGYELRTVLALGDLQVLRAVANHFPELIERSPQMLDTLKHMKTAQQFEIILKRDTYIDRGYSAEDLGKIALKIENFSPVHFDLLQSKIDVDLTASVIIHCFNRGDYRGLAQFDFEEDLVTQVVAERAKRNKRAQQGYAFLVAYLREAGFNVKGF